MRIEDIEPEKIKRTRIINKILNQAQNQTREDNDNVKEQIEANFSNIRALYSNLDGVNKGYFEFAAKVGAYCASGFEQYDEQHKEFRKIVKSLFQSVFTSQRAVAMVNILQPQNDRVYRREGIDSLRFEKSEILKGFKDEVLDSDGINELEVKTLFWINKYIKLMDYKAIDKLKSTPVSMDSQENYFNAKKRLEILKQLTEEFDPKTSKDFICEFNDKYQETFGVSIMQDIETLTELNMTKNNMYNIKNAIMGGLMANYFSKLKRGQDLGGIQAMGVTKNEVGLSDSLGSYMAVIRLKGYTSNIYLHTPSFCYAEVVSGTRSNNLEMLIPSSVYSEVNPDKVLPVNVICKVDKDSDRYKKIKEEQKAKPKNEALKQAEQQVRLAKLKPQQTLHWKHERVEGIPLG